MLVSNGASVISGALNVVVSLGSSLAMMSGCVVYPSRLSSSCLLVMMLMWICSMDMAVTRDA